MCCAVELLNLYCVAVHLNQCCYVDNLNMCCAGEHHAVQGQQCLS